MFSCEFCQISKNIFFSEHLWKAASKNRMKAIKFVSCKSFHVRPPSEKKSARLRILVFALKYMLQSEADYKVKVKSFLWKAVDEKQNYLKG